MGIEKQHESDKITGDKFESTVDRAATGGAGRKPGKTEPEADESDELEIDEGEDEGEDSDEE